ncbi:LLM class flavin-dependent oxidoreductase [Jidongwangia harbinensis]|uniref:LLM class flavin-dependent oxidoreductase n=1 Tax=Jidongwangia harbinensis TaxID=2878561 RepID=UPI001CD9D586|nr:LLM class flavin-dependent oxidoreductase [Jidongwangia harbinensis]MCA2216847.1 LLM class flavin-dependent oxidoreductase [Jidongwangia harbinensis]
MTTLGAIALPQNPPETLPALARAADEAGLEEFWIWEDCFLHSGVAAAAAALAGTGRVRVGIGILPVPFRNVALTAMEIATLRRLFGDRAMVGVGHGVQDWMAQVGARPASPMTLLREYVTALRALLRGETVTVTGRYVNLDGVRLDWPPDPPPELLIGATGPKTLRLSGELADGTILTAGTPPDGVRAARGHIAADDHRVVVFLQTATGPGAAARLTDEVGLAGDAATIAAGVRRWAEAGADAVILQPTEDEPDPAGFLRFVAQEVRPLVDQGVS